MSRFSPGYIYDQMKGIVGFEIGITSIEAAAKISQNFSSRNYPALVTELEKSIDKDGLKVVEWMRESQNEVFHD